MRVDTVLFDLDGTLTDPKVGIIGCLRYALEKMSVTVDPAEDLTWCIGPPMHLTFRKFLGDTEAATVGYSHYRERYGKTGLFENELFAGITDAVAALHESGKRLFVATSKPHVYARPIVEHFGLARYFIAAEGAETDGTRSDKAEVIAHVLATHGVDPATAVMIGDREYDIIGAKKNGLASIGVLYGFGSAEELRAAGADLLCATPLDIPASLARLS